MPYFVIERSYAEAVTLPVDTKLLNEINDDEDVRWLFSYLSLDRMRALCAALGDPQHRLPPVVPIVLFLFREEPHNGLRRRCLPVPEDVERPDEYALAGNLVKRKFSYRADEARKAARFLQYRGFSPSVIRDVLEDFTVH